MIKFSSTKVDAKSLIDTLSKELGPEVVISEYLAVDDETTRLECKFPGITKSRITVTAFYVEDQSTGIKSPEYSANFSCEPGNFMCMPLTGSIARLCFDLGTVLASARTVESRQNAIRPLSR